MISVRTLIPPETVSVQGSDRAADTSRRRKSSSILSASIARRQGSFRPPRFVRADLESGNFCPWRFIDDCNSPDPPFVRLVVCEQAVLRPRDGTDRFLIWPKSIQSPGKFATTTVKFRSTMSQRNSFTKIQVGSDRSRKSGAYTMLRDEMTMILKNFNQYEIRRHNRCEIAYSKLDPMSAKMIAFFLISI